MFGPRSSTIITPNAFDIDQTYDTSFAEVIAPEDRDVNLVIHNLAGSRLPIYELFNYETIDAACPLLTASEFRREGRAYKGFLEAASPELAICFLRYCYTGDYMAIPGVNCVTIGDTIFREPRSTLIDVQIYHMAKRYDMGDLQSRAYANVLEKTEQSCSTPYPPSEMREAIEYLYEHMPKEKQLMGIFLHYSVGCFFYHRLGERGDFLQLVVSNRYFNNDLLNTNHQRKFDSDGAAQIIQMPLAVKPLKNHDHTEIATFFHQTLAGDDTPFDYAQSLATDESMDCDRWESDWVSPPSSPMVKPEDERDMFTHLPMRSRPLAPEDHPPAIGQQDALSSSPMVKPEEEMNMFTHLPIQPQPLVSQDKPLDRARQDLLSTSPQLSKVSASLRDLIGPWDPNTQRAREVGALSNPLREPRQELLRETNTLAPFASTLPPSQQTAAATWQAPGLGDPQPAAPPVRSQSGYLLEHDWSQLYGTRVRPQRPPLVDYASSDDEADEAVFKTEPDPEPQPYSPLDGAPYSPPRGPLTVRNPTPRERTTLPVRPKPGASTADPDDAEPLIKMEEDEEDAAPLIKMEEDEDAGFQFLLDDELDDEEWEDVYPPPQ